MPRMFRHFALPSRWTDQILATYRNPASELSIKRAIV